MVVGSSSAADSVLGPFSDFVMSRSVVVPREDLLGLRRHVGLLVVLARELPYRIERVEPHDGNELDFVVVSIRTSQDPESAIAVDVFVGETREYFLVEETFVLVGVLGFRPTMPDTLYHEWVFGRERVNPRARSVEPADAERRDIGFWLRSSNQFRYEFSAVGT